MSAEEVFEVPSSAFVALGKEALRRCAALTVVLGVLAAAIAAALSGQRWGAFLLLALPTLLALALWLAHALEVALLRWSRWRAKKPFFVELRVTSASIRAVASSGREASYDLRRYRGWEERRIPGGGRVLLAVRTPPPTLRAGLRGRPPGRFSVRERVLDEAGPETYDAFVARLVELSRLPLLRRRRGVALLQFAVLPGVLILWWLAAEALGVAREPMASPRGLLATLPGVPLLAGGLYAMSWLQRRMYAPARSGSPTARRDPPMARRHGDDGQSDRAARRD